MKLEIGIENGKWLLVGSGTFLTASSEKVKMSLTDNGAPLNLFLSFSTDDSKQRKKVVTPANDRNDSIDIEFVNYTNVLGSYTKTPWLIGTAFNRKLYMLYDICAYTDSQMKKIDYSFYLGEEAENGKN